VSALAGGAVLASLLLAVAAAAVLLFLSLTRHLRRARSNAIERGLPVEEPRRHRFDGGASAQSPDVGPVPGTGDRAPGDGTTGDGRREGHDDGRGPTAP
jgi:hypothetical protein